MRRNDSQGMDGSTIVDFTQLDRNVSSIVRQLRREFREQSWLPGLWTMWTAKERACPHCPQPYDGDGLLIQTSTGNGGTLGSPPTNRSGCAA
mgnify:CR=1 FL=1